VFIPIDEAFPAHRKTLHFCALMQDHNAFAYLIRLWAWAARSAADGELAGLDPLTIEFAIQYRHTDGRCYAAMVKAGFIDEDEPGIPARIHGWMDHTGASIQRMEAAAKASRTRKQEWRERRTRDADVPTSETHEERGRNAGQDASAHVENAHRTDKARTGQEDPDLDLSSPSQKISIPDPAGARVAPSVPVTGHSLCLLFGRVRRRVTGKGLDWQSVSVANGKGTSMAELVNATQGAVADVEPSMELIFRWAQAGKAGRSSDQILRDPSFAFGAWCSQWTALREELHGVAPALPEAPPEKRLESLAVAQERQRKEAALDAKVERTLEELRPRAPPVNPREEYLKRKKAESEGKVAAT
jgi:hypothetical protein